MGAGKIRKGLKDAGFRYTKANLAALLAEGYDIMAKSIPLVPVEFSVLRNSRYVAIEGGAVAARQSDQPAVQLGYGTDYAVPVHEKHEVSHRVGQSNYLRQPFDEAMSGLRKRVAVRTAAFAKLDIGPAALPREAPSKPMVKERPNKNRKKK